ncbi:uncharacterized protein LOC107367510 [Tetranychus urticae]|uniref:PHD-type domain-containing protein n=1 Tax=Tetranychus urticae TaxID=32264 RepID=T1KUI9_TETUR|nr:uncharacterized protein LOC107367510 [Tetranychus urticae]
MSTVAKYEGPSARRISGTALAVRTLSGQTKLLVPVSAAAATAKKHSHHKQILVVPTPGGGARLATVANSSSNSSLLRHTHLHPHHNYSSSTGPSGGMKRDSPSYTYNRDGYKSNTASSSRYIGNHDNSNNSAIDTAQLLRQQQLQQQQLREQYLKLKKEEEMIPEWKRKEDFFAALGLVTKQALKEIQNKKCERKRRTTANPQFSNAAIEAKRINAMEVAAKRAKRKEMAAAERHPSASTSAPLTRIARRNSQMPIVPIQSSSLRSSLRPTTSNSSQSAGTSSSSSSFHHKAIFRQYPSSPSTNMTVAPDRSRNLVERLKSRYQLHSSSYQFIPSSNNSNTSNNSRLVNLSKIITAKTLHSCYSCCEACDPDLDAIMFCKDCPCYFHATCVSSVDEINKTNTVPCPGCDKETFLTFDGVKPIPVFDLDSNAERGTKSEMEKPIIEEMEEDNEDPEEEEDDRNVVELDDNIVRNSSNSKVLAHTLDEIQRKISDGKKRQIIVMSKADFLNSQANLPHVSVKTKETLLNRRNDILKLITQGKNRYSDLTTTLSNLKEDKVRLLQERDKITDCIKKLTNVVKLVKDPDEEPPSENDATKPSIPSQESSENNTNNNKNNETTQEKPTVEKAGGSESSSSDDDSSYSDDSDDDEDDQANAQKKSDEGPKGSPKVVETIDESNLEVRIIKSPENNETIMRAPIIHDDEDESLKSLKRQIDQELCSILKKHNTNSDEKQPVEVEQSSSEVPQAESSFVGNEEPVVFDEMNISDLNLGGDEVLISTEEDESNLVIIGNEPVTLEKCSQFDDETSAAVASIQDVLDADAL